MLVDSEKTNTMYLYNLIGKLNVEWCKAKYSSKDGDSNSKSLLTIVIYQSLKTTFHRVRCVKYMRIRVLVDPFSRIFYTAV